MSGLLLSKKRTRSVRSLDSPNVKPPKFDLNDSDASDQEIEQPTKRVALQVNLTITVKKKLLSDNT